MDSFNPTTKTQAAISSAVQAASMAGNPDVTPAHLLGALLAQADGIAAPLLAAVGADATAIRAELDGLIQRLPSASGSTVAAPLFDRQALKPFGHAQNLATEMGDSYVSIEHLLVGLAAEGGAVAQLLRRHGATPDALREAFQTVRDAARVSSPDPEGSYQVLAQRAVFLSYRREETCHIAGRLADRLVDRLGSTRVFMDVDTIEPGADFAATIAHGVASCDVLLALIGPTWPTITDRRGRRKLDDPNDFVVLEIRAALEREIRVIPVLVDGAVMPDEYDLPEGLQGLARRNAIRIDHETFRSDVATLLNTVDRILSTIAPRR